MFVELIIYTFVCLLMMIQLILFILLQTNPHLASSSSGQDDGSTTSRTGGGSSGNSGAGANGNASNSSSSGGGNGGNVSGDGASLRDETLFREANFEALRELIFNVETLCDEYNSFAENPEIDRSSRFFANAIQRNNLAIEQSFFIFWNRLLLRALPQNILHYPGPGVVACDIVALIVELMTSPTTVFGTDDAAADASAAVYGDADSRGDGSGGVTSPVTSVATAFFRSGAGKFSNAGSNEGAAADLLFRELSRVLDSSTQQRQPQSEDDDDDNDDPNRQEKNNRRKPSAEEVAASSAAQARDLLETYVSEYVSSDNGGALLAFYKDFLLKKSVVFEDLLVRHAKVMDNWLF